MSSTVEGGAGNRVPDIFTPPGASERALTMLNGPSQGSNPRWDFHPGDWIRATVTGRVEFKERFTQKNTVRLDLLIEEGTECGEAMTHHAHRALILNHAALRRFERDHSPRVDAEVCVVYHGRDDETRPARHLWRYTIWQGEDSSARREIPEF